MAKSKGSSKSQGSAAVRRREQQRQREQESNRRNQSQARNQPQARTQQRRMQPKSNRRTSILVGGVLLVIALVIVIFIFVSSQSSNGSGSGRTLAPASVVNAVTKVDPSLLSQIGTGGLSNPFKAASGSPLTGPTGKPEVFFYGAEFCPYCAAERWSIVVALSRFGTFHNLGETTSSSTDVYSNTPTFTFYQSSYSSSYIDFVPIENEDRQNNVLQTPTAAEQQLLTHYNVSGYPFMDIGDQYLITGQSYDPTVLRTNPQDQNSQPLSMQDIANQLATGNTLSKNVLGAANYLTAAICSITKNQPSSVCNDPAIQQIETSLSQTPKANVPSDGSPLLALAGSPALDVRRW